MIDALPIMTIKKHKKTKGGRLIYERKKTDTKIICHVILMAVMLVLSIISAVFIFSNKYPSGFEVSKTINVATDTLYGISHIINALALAFGIVYMLKGSGKNAAIYYKIFIQWVTLGILLRLIGTLIGSGFGLSACLMIAIILLLLVLTIVKNLGKVKTYIVYYVLLALEVVLAIVTFDKVNTMPSIAGSLTRLVLIGTIGIAIFAKYADKAARGRD